MRTVVLFNDSTSQFGVMGQMVQDLSRALERMGVRVVIRELEGKSPEELVPLVEKDGPDCTWSINTILDEGWFYYRLGIPHVDLSVDTVTYSHPASFSRPHLVSLFVDKTSCELFSKLSESPVHWFAHAIAKETIDVVRGLPEIPIEDRPYDSTLIGSFIDHEGEKWSWEKLFLPGDVEDFVSLAKRALDDASFKLPFEALAYIERTWSVREVLEKVELSPFSLINSIERYARGLDRERLLEAFSGRKVHIFTGEKDAAAWSLKAAAKDCTFHPAVPFSEVIDVCRKSKIVIHSVPTIRRGFHERLFLALSSGAVTLVNEGGLLPQWLLREGRVVEYKSSSLGGLLANVEAVQRRPYDREKILSWLEREHTWDARLAEYLPQIEASVRKLHDVWEENPFWHMS